VSKILTAPDQLDDLLHDLARGLFDFRREGGAEIEIAAADAEQDGLRRNEPQQKPLIKVIA